MKMQVTNIAAGVNAQLATVQLQEVKETDPSAAPTQVQPSTMQLVVPIDEAGDYAAGSEYTVTLGAAK